MKTAAQLFLEHVKRFWLRMVIFLATLLLGSISYVSPRHEFDLPPTLILAEILRPLACWSLVTAIIRDQRVLRYDAGFPRPISWKSHIGSKLISVLVCINIPLFVCHVATLIAYGIPPLHWIPALLWRQFFVTVYFILPVAALASVTRNDLQLLGAAAVMGAIWVAVFAAFPSRVWDSEGMEWIRWSAAAPVILAGTTVCLLMQYSGRPRSRAWGILCATAGLALIIFRFHPWAPYSALQTWASQERISPTAVLLSFDGSRAGSLPQKIPPRGPVEIVIPIRVEAIPQGLELEEYRSSVRIKGQNGTWRSGWFPAWVFQGLSTPSPLLAISVDRQFYERNRDLPVQLMVDATFTLRRQSHPGVRWKEGIADIEGFGQCRMAHFNDRHDTYTCYSPVFRPLVSLNTIYVVFPDIPTTPSLDPLYASSTGDFWDPAGLKAVTIEAPVAHIRREFEVELPRMSEYKVESPHGGGGIVDY